MLFLTCSKRITQLFSLLKNPNVRIFNFKFHFFNLKSDLCDLLRADVRDIRSNNLFSAFSLQSMHFFILPMKLCQIDLKLLLWNSFLSLQIILVWMTWIEQSALVLQTIQTYPPSCCFNLLLTSLYCFIIVWV